MLDKLRTLSQITSGIRQSQPDETYPPVSPNELALLGPFEHQMVHTRGIRLHCVIAGDKNKPLILLLHGANGVWTDYIEVIAPLASQGYHVAAVDMRGYGMSDKPPTGYDLRHACGDISGLIRALGHGRAVVLGTGTGGSVALALAANYPERVYGVATIDSRYPGDFRKRRFRNIPVTKEEIEQNLRSVTRESFHSTDSFKTTVENRLRAVSIPNALQAMRKNAALEATMPPMEWMEAQIHVPTLIIFDGVNEDSVRLNKHCSGPVTQLNLPDTKLMPYLETPTAFVLSVAQFASCSVAKALREEGSSTADS